MKSPLKQNVSCFLFEKFHQGPEESEESESNPPTEQAVSKSNEVGRVMTEEEYEEWKKGKEGGRQSEEDTGIDWGMGEEKIKVKFLSSPISFICFTFWQMTLLFPL